MIIFFVLAAVPANAGICTNPEARLGFLRHNFAETADHEQSWATHWSLGWAGLTALQLIGIPVVGTKDKRQDLAVGAFGSAMGLLPTFIIPPRALADRELLSKPPQSDSCADVEQFETALERAATDEAFMHSWISHAGSLLFTLGLTAVEGFGLHHWGPAALTLGFGVVVGEIMIYTRPYNAERALARYRAGDFSARSENSESQSLKVSLFWNGDAAAVGLRMDLN
ncbi:MAG: hypothetical protein HY074_03465 [Deltaproteobacteria bacterium]|nr:hypothetical protein [Deltaproteobacteria bacterium]